MKNIINGKMAALILALAIVPVSAFAVESDPLIPKFETNKPSIPIEFSGYFWSDSTYREDGAGKQTESDSTQYKQYGRLVLAAKFRKETSNGYFAEAKAEFIALDNEIDGGAFKAHIRDSYIKLGNPFFDFQAGRFLAWEVYHKGQGMELYSSEETGAANSTQIYAVNANREHEGSAGQFALHMFPSETLKFELSAVYGDELTNNILGVRPVIDASFGPIQIIAGAEYRKEANMKTDYKDNSVIMGGGGRIQYNSDFLTFGINGTYCTYEYENLLGEIDRTKKFTQVSFGGWANINFWRNSIGIGCHYSEREYEFGDVDTHLQPYISYLYKLPFEGVSVKAVFAYAKAVNQEQNTNLDEFENDMKSVRIRIAYDFL